MLAPSTAAARGRYDAFKNYVDQLPPEDPRLFGIPNSQIALLQQDAATLFAALRHLGRRRRQRRAARRRAAARQRAGRMLEDLKANCPSPS